MTASPASPSTPVEGILREFDRQAPSLERARAKLDTLLGELLQGASIRVHQVQSRVKSRESLEKKLRAPERFYASLADVVDVIGLRVITFYADTVDQVTRLIDTEFHVDNELSSDRRVVTEADRFGYVSVHKVCTLSEGRRKLGEYSIVGAMPFEIQVRSILQHAWAEIQHDLEYKPRAGGGPEGVPLPLRRGFARLAAMFGLADDELIRIRDAEDEYLQRVIKELRAESSAKAAAVALDGVTIVEWVQRSSLVASLDADIAKRTGGRLHPEWTPEYVRSRQVEFARFGVTTVGELESILGSKRRNLVTVATQWFSRRRGEEYNRGISLWVLSLFLAGSTESVAQTEANLRRLGLRPPESVRSSVKQATWMRDAAQLLHDAVQTTLKG